MITRCSVRRTTTTSTTAGRTSTHHSWFAEVRGTFGLWTYLVPSWQDGMREVNRQLKQQQHARLAADR